MTGKKITKAKYCAVVKIAVAVPRSLVGNQDATIRALEGNAGDSQRESINTSAKILNTAAEPRWPVKPKSRVHSDHENRLEIYTFLAPKRSNRHSAANLGINYLIESTE